MPDSLLTILRLLLLAMIWLFFLRVLRLMWAGPTVAASAPVLVETRGAIRAPDRAAAIGRPTVRVVSAGELRGKEYSVGNEATIGRGAGCQVLLSDPVVSQLHARIFRTEKDLHIEDLGSKNGTFLNGRKIGPPAKLKKGDRIRVGPAELEVLG